MKTWPHNYELFRSAKEKHVLFLLSLRCKLPIPATIVQKIADEIRSLLACYNETLIDIHHALQHVCTSAEVVDSVNTTVEYNIHWKIDSLGILCSNYSRLKNIF